MDCEEASNKASALVIHVLAIFTCVDNKDYETKWLGTQRKSQAQDMFQNSENLYVGLKEGLLLSPLLLLFCLEAVELACGKSNPKSYRITKSCRTATKLTDSSHLLCESDSIDWEDIGSILALGEGHLDRFRQH